ncbi:hypothetical protein [Streptomyces tubercidicus]|uniref:Uncharacterized protein n=1 Tax=Streptomyces tubercidicus TaxID=47759 RepID=A0A640UU60_9ACTN|nr:hypothetical protein [Streptomyces tubercidicus]WAU13700.1 hypothetical protein STRTU_004228 [Streptomyces tubercidicus]GFE39339.1 hypothetical protein Stube_40120 [Streptomyces tubercidicus]
MSDFARTHGASTTTTGGEHPDHRPDAAAHEAYSFACMRCGYGWEQAYEIVHEVDGKGELHVVYYADGERVRSPLTCPTCVNCGSDVVRIMRSGQVSMVSAAMASMHQRGNGGEKKHGGAKNKEPAAADPDGTDDRTAGDKDTGRHHWHLSDLLHPFQHHRK